jgi:hypothetical protein
VHFPATAGGQDAAAGAEGGDAWTPAAAMSVNLQGVQFDLVPQDG